MVLRAFLRSARRSLALAVVLATPLAVAGETPAPRQITTAPPQTTAVDPLTVLSRAQDARAAGRIDDALRLADQVIALMPDNWEAVSLKIEMAIATRKRAMALDAYEKYADVLGGEDRRLLGLIAHAELKALGASGVGRLMQLAALERLARLDDQEALDELTRDAERKDASKAEVFGADAALARLGDPGAVTRLRRLLLSDEVRDRTPIIEALEAAEAKPAASALITLMDDPNPLTQAAAAEALGSFQATEAIPRLKAALAEGDFLVRIAAAIGLKRLGDASADALLAQWLQSELGEVRLKAAEAYTNSISREWVKAIQPLLNDHDQMARLRAAELLKDVDSAAEIVITELVQDGNPAVRQEASRVLEESGPYDLLLLRRLLRDESAWVRLHAAAAILASAGA